MLGVRLCLPARLFVAQLRLDISERSRVALSLPLRIVEDLLAGPILDDLPGVHDRDVVGKVAHDREIV